MRYKNDKNDSRPAPWRVGDGARLRPRAARRYEQGARPLVCNAG